MGLFRLVLLIAALALAGGAWAQGDYVTISQGRLEGITAGVVTAFKGVPYAAAPVGALRWRPPGAPARWAGVRRADRYGAACMQPTDLGVTGRFSEDCLTLNIWTPAGRATGPRLPVMVWIHGGGFVSGAGSLETYDGTQFAVRNVVLVTINYRLGRFGFFAHPALTKADPEGLLGNYGLMDQIAALKWVKANIAAFGGDPGNVTIFGQSAGGISVNYLLTSPLAKGLFAKAIAESGFGRTRDLPIHGVAQSAEAIGVEVAQGLGVKGDDAAALAALRAMPAERFLGGTNGLSDPKFPAPMIDGRLIEKTIVDAFAAGDEARAPMLEGGNSWDASLLPDLSKDARALARFATVPAAAKAMWGDEGDTGKLINDYVTDQLITEPDRYLARQTTKAGGRAYVYFFSHVPVAQRGQFPGAPHSAEVPYAFETLPDHAYEFGLLSFPAPSPADRKLADAMIAYWVAFARSGDPGSAGGVAWPAVSASDDVVLEFGDDGPVVHDDFRKARLDWMEVRAARRQP